MSCAADAGLGLGAELLEIYRQSYGVGAAEVSVEISDRFVVFCFDGLELLPNEQILIEAGEVEAVREQRDRFQRAIEAPSRAAVEHATGRRVTSFAGATGLDPPHLLAVFRLAPE